MPPIASKWVATAALHESSIIDTVAQVLIDWGELSIYALACLEGTRIDLFQFWWQSWFWDGVVRLYLAGDSEWQVSYCIYADLVLAQ